MKRILYFYPSNKRTISLETQILEVKALGNDIFFLTTCEEGDLHYELSMHGIRCYSHKIETKSTLKYYFLQTYFLIKFCRKNSIDIIFSNLQHTNLISVFAQYFIPAKVIAFRHHFIFTDEIHGLYAKRNKNGIIGDKIINHLATKIIVPSRAVYKGMVELEKANINKLGIIPYMYNFDNYGLPNERNAELIRERFAARLRIIMVSRLVPLKRHITIFPAIKELVDQGYDVKMLVLDEGTEKKRLQEYIDNNNLRNNIFMLGFQRNFLDYMEACDLMIHPSLTEASNSAVKEMGLMKKIVAVCKGVGDFDDYITAGVNGFFMEKENPRKDALTIIKKLYKNKNGYESMGSNLRRSVIKTFQKNPQTINQLKELIDN